MAFSDRVAVQLQRDVEEIDRALKEFLEERLSATRLQDDAFRAYENEMKEFEEVEEDVEVIPEATADHNVYRANNIVMEGNDDLDFGYGLDEEFSVPSQFEETKLRHLIGFVEKKVLTVEERSSLRLQMFEFLETARQEEEELEQEYERSKNFSSKEADAAAEKYFGTQKRNAVKLRKIIDEYQPVPFSKAWGNDPDYAKLTMQLKAAMIGDEDINVKKILRGERKKKDRKLKLRK